MSGSKSLEVITFKVEESLKKLLNAINSIT